ncbi:MAG TPA: hypothetical protein VFN61_00375 [Acidimicrobiales bacterium]|nr:hypothetical protein [Acidimicrobiales bacterium]
MADQRLRKRYERALIGRLDEGGFPSASLLDRIESVVNDRESAEEYVAKLLARVERERYPSPVLLDRISRLLAYL